MTTAVSTRPASRRGCPSCGHEPASRPEALQQRDDLTICWLHQSAIGAPINEHRHCVHCQPHVPVASLACAECGDGPLLTGVLAEQASEQSLPTALQDWLSNRGWRTSPELLCPREG